MSKLEKKSPIASVLFMDEEVSNKDRKFGSTLSYYPSYLVSKSGELKPMLFTRHEIEMALNRAEKNQEDTDLIEFKLRGGKVGSTKEEKSNWWNSIWG